MFARWSSHEFDTRVEETTLTQRNVWKRLMMVVAILMIGSLVLAACGDDNDDADPTNTSGTGQSGATSTTGAAGEATATEAMADDATPTGGDDEEPMDLGDLSGEINIDGSSTVFPISQAVAEEFNAEAPDVNITVGASGTGGGFKKFCAGDTDISNASRPIKDEEAAICEENGIEFTELQVAIDGLSVVVNPANDWVNCITTEQLNTIWMPESTVDTWSDVDPSWPDEAIELYGPGTDSGTFDYFTEEINGEGGASRSDYTASEDDNVLVQGVSGDETAMGYFGYAYYVENRDSLKVLAIDGGEGCVEPTPETVASGTYAPLSRPIFVYVSHQAMERPEVAAFAEFMVSDIAQEIIPEVGYVTMDDTALEEQRAKIESMMP